MSKIAPFPRLHRAPQTADEALRSLFETTSNVRRLLRDGDSFGAYVVALDLIIWEPPRDAAPAIVARLESHRLASIRELSDLDTEIHAAAARHRSLQPVSPPMEA